MAVTGCCRSKSLISSAAPQIQSETIRRTGGKTGSSVGNAAAR